MSDRCPKCFHPWVQHHMASGQYMCWEPENPYHNGRCRCTLKQEDIWTPPGKVFASRETEAILDDVNAERIRQDQKWGPLSYQVGSNAREFEMPSESRAQSLCDQAHKDGKLTWGHILVEELAEVLDSFSEEEREKELIQLAAVAVWAVEDLRRKRRSK